jgi:hypothetical protein
MPKYRISYTTEDWWQLDVEAADIDDAMDKFHHGGYNHSDAVLTEGGYLQDSVDIHPLED